TRARPRVAGTVMEISRFPCKRLVSVPGSTTTRGRRASRESDAFRVAFCRPREHRHPELGLRRSIPGLLTPRSTLRLQPRGCTRMTWGRCGSLRPAPGRTFPLYLLPVSRRTRTIPLADMSGWLLLRRTAVTCYTRHGPWGQRDETARVHHAARRRGGHVAALGARAADWEHPAHLCAHGRRRRRHKRAWTWSNKWIRRYYLI